MLRNFYFFRHGETDWNKEKRVQGTVDRFLCLDGKNQAKKLSQVLADKNLEIIFSSNLKRAIETSEIVASECGVEIELRHDLRECHFGDIEGLLYEDVKKQFGEELWQEFRKSNPVLNHSYYPNAESPASVFKRVDECLNEILRSNYETIGISTHGVVLRNFIHPLIDESLWPLPIPNCAAFHLTYSQNKWNYIGTIDI